MYELAKKTREDMKSKARRLTSGNSGDIDASGWRELTDMHPEVKTGERPISKQGFACDGSPDKPRADRVARKSGGKVADWVNRNVKEANEDRPGKKFDGGYARGGKMTGGALGYLSPALMIADSLKDKDKKSAGGALDGGSRPQGGRIARKSGGKAGKTNINIIVGSPKEAAPAPMPIPPPMPMPHPMPPVAGPPPMGGPPMAPPPGMMPRKRGGRAYPIEDGAGGGKGRREKIEAYGDKA